tara:strand:- start:45 stop:398 length:354 start_codon:yes stop_codon:yes gene_type:complete
MFSVKVFNNKKDRSKEFNRTISTILGYIRETIGRRTRIVSDDFCVELVSGIEEEPAESSGIVTELLIKKTIFINTSDLNNRDMLDRYLTEIRNFCNKADKIEGVEYLPINFRQRNNE